MIKLPTNTSRVANEVGFAVLVMAMILVGVATFLILFDLVNASQGFREFIGSGAGAFAAYFFIVSVYRGCKASGGK